MRGGYDLYGNYYPNANDALSAEMAQCNEIDNRINSDRLSELERKQYNQSQDKQRELWELAERCAYQEKKIEMLEKRIEELEEIE